MVISRRSDPKARKLKQKAEEAYAKQKWDKALKLYQELEFLSSYDPRAGQRIGDVHRRLGEKNKAIKSYKRVAQHYAREGFWAKAIAMDKMILELDPADQEIQKQLADMYSAQGMPDQTVAHAMPRKMSEPPEAISISGQEPLTMEQDSLEQPIELSLEDQVITDTSTLGKPTGFPPKIPLFSDLSRDELNALLSRLAVRKFPVDAFVCEEGDVGQSMYIIAEGYVEVSIKEEDGTRLVLDRLQGGDFFGEFSLLTKSERNATVQAKTELEVLEITQADFDKITAVYPRVWTVLEDYLSKRVVDTILMRSPVFRALTKEERKNITNCLSLQKAQMDEVIMEENTAGEEMYFIQSGKVSVTSRQGTDRVLVGELEKGDYFGEVAMLTGKNRTATVRAVKDCDLLRLTRKDAARILRGNPEILERLKGKMAERAQETASTIETYQEARTTLALV